MLDAFQKTRIVDTNALWWGHAIGDLMEDAGKGISTNLLKLFGKNKNYTFLCGLGNNGGDGLCAARYLATEGAEVTVLLFGRENEIKSSEAKTQFYHLKQSAKKNKNLKIIQDAYVENIQTTDVVVEALLGAGIHGRVFKRFGDAIKKISKLMATKVSIDIPVPGYKPNQIFSLHFEKVKDSKVIDIGIPQKLNSYVGPGEVGELYQPPKESYKTQTGEIFVFGGSDTFHGAPLMAIQAASKFVGSVYFYTTPGNRELIQTLKSKVCEFITVNDSEIEKYANYADVLLFGPGLQDNLTNRAIIEKLFEMFPSKIKILDAYAIAMAPQDKLKNCILTPHRGELRHIWKEETKMKTQRLESNLRRFAVEKGCYVILKGHTDFIFMPSGEVKLNITGNPGMAKGGTGDVLSGIVASFATKNDLELASEASIFISGFAGDLAYKDYGYNFSATDIVPYLQKAVKICLDVREDKSKIQEIIEVVDPNKRV